MAYMQETNTQLADKLATVIGILQGIADSLGDPPTVKPEIQAAVEERLAKGLCLQCGLKLPMRYTRGLCANHYNQAVKEWQTGGVSERKMIELGRITPQASKGGRKTKSGPSSWDTPITADDVQAETQLAAQSAAISKISDALADQQGKPKETKGGKGKGPKGGG